MVFVALVLRVVVIPGSSRGLPNWGGRVQRCALGFNDVFFAYLISRKIPSWCMIKWKDAVMLRFGHEQSQDIMHP